MENTLLKESLQEKRKLINTRIYLSTICNLSLLIQIVITLKVVKDIFET